MNVTDLTPATRPTWDDYVRRSPHGLPQHLSGWADVLREAHGHDTHFLLAREDDAVVGVMPLFLVRSLLLGDRATTMPGGLCADSEEAAAALIARAQTIAQEAGVDRLVLHDTRTAWPAGLQTGLQTSTNHVHWVVDIDMSADDLWSALDGNIRRQVRIARRNNLTTMVDRSGRVTDDFYHVLSRVTHQFGTPVFGRDFLQHVVNSFPDNHNVAVTYKDGQPIAGYFQLEMAGTVHGLWGAALHDYLDLRASYQAIWCILEDAIEHGFKKLDMGRSPAGSGASKFKGQWGGVSRPIHQQFTTFDKQDTADPIADRIQSDGKMQWMMRLWPKLPLPVAQFLGPRLRRHVPFA